MACKHIAALRSKAPLILYLGTRWRSEVNFAPWP